ncbi:hypothetical protein K438DRAFT_2032560 [Mycena galopus ATCC 62051]|nr:hypothetical protein K438DRAFT_2032560 [Mycena galopus ATCC 62051]
MFVRSFFAAAVDLLFSTRVDASTNVTFPDLYEATIAELQAASPRATSPAEVNDELHAVIETSPTALAQAAALDEQRKQGTTLGPLHGIPMLVKDNITTRFEDGMNTTSGSYALFNSVPSLVTVPLGFLPNDTVPDTNGGAISIAPGLPFGLTFVGTAFSESKLLAFAYAYEQATQTRLNRAAYEAATPKTQLVDVVGKNSTTSGSNSTATPSGSGGTQKGDNGRRDQFFCSPWSLGASCFAMCAEHWAVVVRIIQGTLGRHLSTLGETNGPDMGVYAVLVV